MNKRTSNAKLPIIYCISLSVLVAYSVYKYYCIHRIGDSDYYWHIMLGRAVLTGQSSLDSLVWTNSIYNTAYKNYSLLSDIILYKLSCVSKDETFGALLYMLLCAFVTSFLVFWGWGKNAIMKIGSSVKGSAVSILALIFSVWLLSMTRGNPRPHLMALPCFITSVKLLESRRAHSIYFLIPLAAIWANLHGASMPLLIVMELLYIIISLPIFKKLNIEVPSYSKETYIRRFLVIALSFLAGLCNPVGIDIYMQLFRVSNNTNITPIKEWNPATISSSVGVVLFIGFLVIWGLSKEKISAAKSVPIAITGMLMLLHVRFESWFFVAIAIHVMDRAGEGENTCKAGHSRARKVTSVVLMLITVFCILNMSTNKIHSLRPLRYPSEEVIEIVKKYSPKHMYNDASTGAFFEYNGIPVIMDSRIDMYSEEFLRDMNTFRGKVSVTDGTIDYTETILKKYDIDMVTLCRGDSMILIGYMSQRADWRLIYQDNAYVIFKKL